MKIGEVTYDELPKTMLISVVNDADKDFVIDTIMKTARTSGKGAFGDGKIFVSAVEEVYTISSGVKRDRRSLRGGPGMKEIIAVIRMNKMNQTKQALTEAGIAAFFAHEALGRGKGFVNPDVLKGAGAGLRGGRLAARRKRQALPETDAHRRVPRRPRR